jgi:hypothetical protein
MGVTAGADQHAAPGWHHLLDLTTVMASAFAALGLALAGQAPAAFFFVALTVVRSGLNVTTRYVTAT